jgi:gliding motility associated protien GldN
MKLVCLLSAIFLINIVTFGQLNSPIQIGPSNISRTESGNYPGVVDGVYMKKDVLAKKRAIPYEFVRENDYVWGKRTWSSIDLREKINHPLYYPIEVLDTAKGTLLQYAQNRYSLYYILSQAILKQEIWGFYDSKAYDPGAGVLIPWKNGDAFQYPCRTGKDYQADAFGLVADVSYDGPFEKSNGQDAQGNALKVFVKKGAPKDSIRGYLKYGDRNTMEAYDPTTETQDPKDAEMDSLGISPELQKYFVIKTSFFQPGQITKYLLKEDWFFDKERSILDVRTIGLAPVMQTDSTEKILFWVYFPQARDVLKNYYVYDAKSTVGGNTFDHLFMTRRFNAVVYKESSLYDRKIEDYRFGADALYESEKVKNTIRTFEHDVWNF